MEERIYYPLTSSQHTLFLARKYSIHKSITNVPTSIIVKDDLDLDLLEDAVRKAITRWDVFGLRLVKEGSQQKQYFGEREVEYIGQLDFTGKTREEMTKKLEKLGSKKLDVYEAPLARIYIMKTPEGYGGIFSVISHMIMDSWSISMFYKDCFDIYFSMAKGTPFPKDIRDYENVLKKEIAYRQSDQYQKDVDYWTEDNNSEEPIYTDLTGDGLEKFRKKKKDNSLRHNGIFYIRNTAQLDMHWLEKDKVEPMAHFIEEHQFPSMQVLFQMGLRTYLAKVNNHEEDISYYNVCARRGTLEEKRTGGTRVHFITFRTIMPKETTFLDGCRMLYDKQNELYRHADFPPMEMLDIEQRIRGLNQSGTYRSLSMTYQPVAMKLEEDVEIETRWYSNGAVASPFYLTIMDGDGTGGFKCYYEYMSNIISEETIKDLHRYMTKVMVEGAKNPDITLDELYALY
jgi:hypothetical protein